MNDKSELQTTTDAFHKSWYERKAAFDGLASNGQTEEETRSNAIDYLRVSDEFDKHKATLRKMTEKK